MWKPTLCVPASTTSAASNKASLFDGNPKRTGKVEPNNDGISTNTPTQTGLSMKLRVNKNNHMDRGNSLISRSKTQLLPTYPNCAKAKFVKGTSYDSQKVDKIFVIKHNHEFKKYVINAKMYLLWKWGSMTTLVEHNFAHLTQYSLLLMNMVSSNGF